MNYRTLTTEEFLSVNPPTSDLGSCHRYAEELKERFITLLECSESVRQDANAEVEKIEAILASICEIV